jgi:hypothetical protein
LSARCSGNSCISCAQIHRTSFVNLLRSGWKSYPRDQYGGCTAGAGGHDSVWQDSSTYTDIGLAADVIYTYKVKTRDKSSAHNETDWSNEKSALIDFTKPTPNPSEWLVEPYEYFDGSKYHHKMEAKKATDLNGFDPNNVVMDPNRVEYYFECANSPDSNWQISPVYDANNVPGPNLLWSYRVKTRDKSVNHNETTYSSWAVAEP